MQNPVPLKIQFNLTDSRYDLERFPSRQALFDMIRREGFDGIELMHMEEDSRAIIAPEMVVGFHMSIPQYWLDFWRGDLERCTREFDTLANVRDYYGGLTPDALVQMIRREYAYACQMGAEYVVIHVSEAAPFEEITSRYNHSDLEVITGFCEMMNEALQGDFLEGCLEAWREKSPLQSEATSPGRAMSNTPWVSAENFRQSEATSQDRQNLNMPLLLMENLWQPGLTFTDPQMTSALLEGVSYPSKGLVLDTGHLMHTNPLLRSQKEAVQYIHRQLDAHGELCRYIRGMHLQQSLTGPTMKRYQKNPPEPAASYQERMGQMFTYVFQIDQHKPFVGEGVRKLIARVAPQYLTFEFISNNLPEHLHMLRRQWGALRDLHIRYSGN